MSEMKVDIDSMVAGYDVRRNHAPAAHKVHRMHQTDTQPTATDSNERTDACTAYWPAQPQPQPVCLLLIWHKVGASEQKHVRAHASRTAVVLAATACPTIAPQMRA